MKILLVDDKEENLYLLEKLLQGNGYVTLSAANGAEALAAALKNPPDLIVSDILMPVMDGFTLCREWRKNKVLTRIPFVFYTATYTDPKDEAFALSVGADRFIIKPQAMNDLLKIIRETLNTQKVSVVKAAHPHEEKVFLKEYNEALVRKLEDKMTQLEAAEKELRKVNAALEKDLEKRRQAEEILKESEEKFKAIFNTVGDNIFMVDVERNGEYRFTSVNQMFLRTTGLPLDAIVGRRVRDVIPEPSLTMALGKYKQAIQEKAVVRWEEVSNYPTGKLIGEVSIAPLFDEEGNCIHLVGAVHDITDRKRVEEEIRKTQILLQASVESPKDMIILSIDKNYRYLYFNSFHEHVMKISYGKDLKMGMNLLDCITNDEDRRKAKINYDRALNGTSHVTTEEYGDLERHYYETRYNPIFNDKNEIIGATAFSANVTDRKQAEEKLNTLTLRQQAILAAVPDIIMEVDNKKVYSWANKAGIDFFGDEVIGKEASSYFEGDQVTYNVIQPLFNGNEDIIYIESWQRRKDGEKRLLAWWCHVLKDTRGNVTGALSSARDITERKQAEEALRESEKRYRMLFDQMTGGFAVHEIILDSNNQPVDYRFLQVNTAFEQLTGLRAKDIIGKTVLEILPKTESSFIQQYGEVALTGKDVQFESYSQELNKYYNIRAYAPEHGKFATVFEDITKRKLTEEALATEQFRMNMLMDNAPDHIYFKDKESRFMRMNKSQAARFGLNDPAAAVGKTDFDFFSKEHAQPAFEDEQKIMITGQPLIGLEEKETWPDGRVTWVITTKMPLRDKEGEIIGTFGISRDITERKHAEEELSKSEEKYRSIFENVQDVYYEASINGTILEISPSIEIVSKGQYKRDDLIGKSMYDFYSDIEKRQTLLTLLQKQGTVSDFEFALKNRDGSFVPCSISSKICFDAEGHPQKIIGSMRDITARKQAEESLRETRDYLENLLSFANAPILVWDPDFKITRFNLALERLTGYTINDVVGKHLEMLFPAENRKSSLSHIASTSGGDHLITVEIPLLCKNGSVRTVLWSTANIYAADGRRLVSTIAQGQDITEQKKLQLELIQSQKMESIGTLAGGIAHDFNNILGIILGYSTLLERETLSKDKFHESLGIINNAVGRGAALVGQILTFARKTDVVFEPIHVSDLIHELLSMLRQTFPRVITFIEVIDKNIPCIKADRIQFHQMLMNLCVNARDAMPNGGTITIKAEIQTKLKVQKRFHAADQDSYLCISVTDTGEGMNEATQRQIFDPFFTTKEQGKGTGLGLAVVYGAVQSHHGFIEVESEVGRGTIFLLYFPIPPATEQTSDDTQSTTSFTVGGTETILLVEDEEVLLDIVRFMLESNGYKVHTAKDGHDAIKVYKQHQLEIDLVLTDMGLPGMTGKDVFKTLKKVNPKINVIIASGFIEPDIKSELEITGAKGFIQKPYSPDEVLRSLRQVLDAKSDEG